MKNITVLSVLVIIFFLFSAVSAHCREDLQADEEWLQADNNNEKRKTRRYGFSILPQSGFVYGESFELVYPTNTKGEFLSELIWDMKPVFYLGLQLYFERIDLMSAPGFFTSLDFKIGIPGDSGIIENRDWQSTENDALTDYSSHTNKTRSFYWLDFVIGASLPVKNYFYVKPFISLSWMHFAFTGRDGYGVYARQTSRTTFLPIIDNPSLIFYHGQEVIRYQQDWFLAAVGLSIGTKILSPFHINLSFQISPFTYCAARDDHLSVQFQDRWSDHRTYMDFTGWGLFIEPKGSISLKVKPLEFSLEFAWRHIGNTRGNTYSKIGNSQYFSQSGEAGAGLSVMDSRFMTRIRF